MEQQFEALYGPEGDWVRLFRQRRGYLRTELVRDAADSRRYLTLDFWESRESYEDFRRQSVSEYKKIDAKGENLTESEREIGRFEEVGL